MSERVIPKEKLTAFQRWELGALREHVTLDPVGAEPDAMQAARSAAREEGYRAGNAEGQRLAAQAAAHELERLRALLARAESNIVNLEHHVAEDMLDLALELARQVLRGELSARRDALLPVVREAMASLAESALQRKLILHPSDVDIVRSHLGDELKLGNWQVVEDHLIEPGGCRVTSLNGEVDATLETRWKRVLQGVRKTHAWHAD